jgi:arsenate reductase (thioredoxin)
MDRPPGLTGPYCRTRDSDVDREDAMTSQEYPRVALTTEQKLQIKQAGERLKQRFDGVVNAETIERFMNDSLDQLIERARVTKWVPLLAERYAGERLRVLVRLQAGPSVKTPAVLFMCVHNAGRSQMAAGWMRSLAGDRIEVFSGGSEPAEMLNRGVVQAMAEVGIDITAEIPMPWADEVVRAADVVVTMGCGDACPLFPGKRYVDWELEDPSGKSLEEIRPIRDEIEQRVRGLMAELGVAPTA